MKERPQAVELRVNGRKRPVFSDVIEMTALRPDTVASLTTETDGFAGADCSPQDWMEKANDMTTKYEDMCFCHGRRVHRGRPLKWADEGSQTRCRVCNVLTDVRRVINTAAQRVSRHIGRPKPGSRRVASTVFLLLKNPEIPSDCKSL